MSFSGRDESKGDVRNTGKVPTFSLVMMPMKSADNVNSGNRKALQ